jgi:hypothetical protein
MTMAFVLGNGISRQQIDLAKLIACGPVYGCNALYREFAPTVLVATDRPISEQIQQSGYPLQHCFYTRNPIPGLGSRRIPDTYWAYSSGPAAVGLAAAAGHKQIYLLGFDMGATEHNRFNNVYSDTEFYKASTAVPTYTGNWVRQIQQVAEQFPDTDFVRVHGSTTADIEEFEKIANISRMSVADFLHSFHVLKS